MKKSLLAIAVAAVFIASYNVAAYAVVDRDWYRGYFTNSYDSSGDNVLQNNANDGYGHYNSSSGGYDAIPPSVNTVDEFITFIRGKLSSNRIDYGTVNNAANWDRTGAAFIVQTMIGQGRNRPPSAAELADWEARIRHAASLGHINWNTYASAAPNTFYQIHRNDGSSSVNDVAWFNSTGSGPAIVFYADNGSIAYMLRRQCANPVGNPLPLTQSTWNAVGSTVVTDDDGAAPGDTSTNISVRPGATVRFRSSIVNNGPANSCNWYHITGRNGGTTASVPWTGQYFSNVSLSGSPTFTRTDTNLVFDWGTGGPGNGVPVDNFSVRWTKTENFAAGNYWFTIVGDDGVRLYIDGVLRLDAWVAQGATSYHYNTNLTAGNHTIRMDYFESGGPGYSRLDYSNAVYVGGTDSGCYSAGQSKTPEDVYVPVSSSAAAGTQICRRILWDWKNSAGSGEYGIGTAGWGRMACATVTGSYTLSPVVVPSTTFAQQGDTVTFRYDVTNTGTINSGSVACSIAATHPSGTPSPPATNCPRVFNAGATVQATNAVESITIGSQPAGSQICRTLTVNPGTSGGAAVNSPQVCIRIGKKPYVHFMGSDVWAGGGFTAANGTCTTNTTAKIQTSSTPSSAAGSAVEYAAFALGDITRFGSGNKPLHNSSDFADLGRRLSFANNTTNIGRFGAPQHCINDYSSLFDSLPIGGALPISDPTSGAWHSASFPSLSGTAPAGVTKVYYSEGDVTITDEIQYPDTYNSVNDIPSIVVIAKGNIYVESDVNRMDGIYITRGTFFTCYPKPSPPTNSTCNEQLVVNGAVIANSIDLYRTFGGDGSTTALRQRPAEIFNFSPELFLNNALNTTTNSSVTTSDSRELPPRF